MNTLQISQTVGVKLEPLGLTILKEYCKTEDVYQYHIEESKKNNNVFEFPLWMLMKIFGPYFTGEGSYKKTIFTGGSVFFESFSKVTP